VTFREAEAARRAVQDPNPTIAGRRANCNIASMGPPRAAQPRGEPHDHRSPTTPSAGRPPPFHGEILFVGRHCRCCHQQTNQQKPPPFPRLFFGCSAGVRHCYHEPIHVRERNNGIADESVMRDPPRIIMRVKPPARLSRVMPRLAVSVGFALLRAAPTARRCLDRHFSISIRRCLQLQCGRSQLAVMGIDR
jgi:hypothetical protein